MRNFFFVASMSLVLVVPNTAAGSSRSQSQGQTQSKEPGAGLRITAKEASALEEDLLKNPDNLTAREQLISYYYRAALKTRSAELEEKKEQHVFWVIEHHPESELAGSPEAEILPIGLTESTEGYERGKHLWLEQAKRHPDSSPILRNAARFLAWLDGKISRELLEKALALDPNDRNTASMLAQSLERERISVKSPEEKMALAKQAFSLRESTLIGVDCEQRFYALGDVAEAALKAGETVKAEQYGSELLQSAEKLKKNRNYGDAVHKGNIILGRIALQRGDIVSAKQHLLAAGETPGSPLLDFSGPDTTLAKELLEKGEREAVLTYLESCAKFWKMGGDKLQSWIATVRGGGVPDFSRF